MDLSSYNKTLTEIYLASNTPLSLFDFYRNNSIVQDLSQRYSSEELIKEFYLRAERPITSVEQIAEIYTLFVALTFKENSEVNHFFEKVRDMISFEWFSSLSKYYLKNYASLSTYNSIEIFSDRQDGDHFSNTIELISF